MRDLIILGTGVHAAEMAHIVDRINLQRPTWRLLGFISGKPTEQSEMAGHPILGTRDALDRLPDAALVPEFSFPHAAVPPETLVNVIDPDVFLHPSARLGRGCVLYPGCFVGYQAQLGDCIFALGRTTINHDDVIGDRTVFATGATLAGCVTVENDCYVGQSAAVRQHLRIGHHSLIGMGAVVVKDVEPNSVMAGNPARLLRRSEEPTRP